MGEKKGIKIFNVGGDLSLSCGRNRYHEGDWGEEGYHDIQLWGRFKLETLFDAFM